MAKDDPDNRGEMSQSRSGQARNFDSSPERFRESHSGDRFSGASGVLFEQAMAQTRMAICLCDPKLPDIPIVFANRAFRELTGYDEEDIIGRNCRFLQGPETDPQPVAKIRDAIVSEDVVVVELLNYRKDGTPFWNALHLGPIYDDRGELIYFFGSQWDVSDVRAARSDERHALEMARELSHRMKNMFAVISGIVNVSGREHGIEPYTTEINERIQALGRAYETTLDDAHRGDIGLGEAVQAIVRPYAEGAQARLQMEGNGERVPFTLVSLLGLVLHELAREARAGGVWDDPDATITLDWGAAELPQGETIVVHWTEMSRRDGPDEAIAARPLIERMLSYAAGEIFTHSEDKMVRTTINIPVGGAL